MTLAEDVLLVAHVNGELRLPATSLDVVLAGAAVIDLAVAGRLQVGPPLLRGQTRLRTTFRGSTGDAIQDTVLRHVLSLGEPPVHQVLAWPTTTTRWLRADLTSRGLLRHTPARRRWLGQEPTWTTVDTRGAVELLERIILVIADRGITDDLHARALTRLLAPCGVIQALLPERRSGIPTDLARRVLAMLIATDPVANGIRRVYDDRAAAAAHAAASFVLIG